MSISRNTEQDNYTSLQPYLQDIELDLQNKFMHSNEDSMHTGDKVRLFKEGTTEMETTYYIAILVFNRNLLYVENYISFLRQMTEETADDFLLHFVLVADMETYNAIIEPLPSEEKMIHTGSAYRRFLYETPVDEKQIKYASNVIVDMYTTSLLNLRGVDLLKGIGAKRAFINKLFSDNFSDDETFQIMVLDDNITGICDLKTSGLTPRNYNSKDKGDHTGIHDIPVLNVALQLFADSAKDIDCIVRGIIKGQGIGEDKKKDSDENPTYEVSNSRAVYKMSVQKVNLLKKLEIFYSIYFTRCLEDLLFLAQLSAKNENSVRLDKRYKLRFGHYIKEDNENLFKVEKKNYIKEDNEDLFKVEKKNYEPSPPVKGIEMPYLFCIEYINTIFLKSRGSISLCYYFYNNIPIINFNDKDVFTSKYAIYQIAIIILYFFVFLGSQKYLCNTLTNEKINHFALFASKLNIINYFKLAYKKKEKQEQIKLLQKLGDLIQKNDHVNFKKEIKEIISEGVSGEELQSLFSERRTTTKVVQTYHTLKNTIKTAAKGFLDKVRITFNNRNNPKKTGKVKKAGFLRISFRRN